MGALQVCIPSRAKCWLGASKVLAVPNITLASQSLYWPYFNDRRLI